MAVDCWIGLNCVVTVKDTVLLIVQTSKQGCKNSTTTCIKTLDMHGAGSVELSFHPYSFFSKSQNAFSVC